MASGSRARRAAIYPFALCKAILQGCRDQLRHDRRLGIGIHGVQPEGWDSEDRQLEELCALWCEGDSVHKLYDQDALAMNKTEVYRDAITGQVRGPRLVVEARRE